MLGAEPNKGYRISPHSQSFSPPVPWRGVAGAEDSRGALKRGPGAVSSKRMKSSLWQPLELRWMG